MKRIVIVVLLVAIAGIAGIVRSRPRTFGGVRNLSHAIHEDRSATTARDEVRKSFELSSGARVEVRGINGAVKIETSDRKTAEVFIERFGASQEVLDRRKIVIDSTSDSLTIHGEKGDTSFFERLFGSSPTERVTLQLPRSISLAVKGVNGSVSSGELEGPVEVVGVNGKVDVAQASGAASFKGINGQVAVALKQIDRGGVEITGVNGNVELQLSDGVNANLDARGMNGAVISELAGVTVDKRQHGRYTAQIGSGGNSISAAGINGNIRLTRMMVGASGDQ
ncbi:MAG TPA: hypothetical protein VJT50_10155 [Pyrinomonadaceae bacterium]|nr:hypothetical protein [Pyrinomonadaceae bacterium]